MNFKKIILLAVLLGSPAYGNSPKSFFMFKEYLTQKDFGTFLKRQMMRVKHVEKNDDRREIKLEGFKKIEKVITELPKGKTDFYFRSKHKLFESIIWDVFKGDPQKGAHLYSKLTIGKGPENLFISSGAGKKERIRKLRKVSGGYEFVTDRVYVSNQAYNTKNKVRLQIYKLSGDTYVCVNRHVRDYGLRLKKKGVKRAGKTYGPIVYDMTIDFYHRIDKKTFQYVSYNIYEGQTDGSRFRSVNAVKSIGNILTLGAVNKGVGMVVKRQAKKVWSKRKVDFQRLLLK